jgi:hypothetical protein
VVALAAAGFACASLSGAPRDGQRVCWPLFAYQDGWLGGDGAYSVPLPAGRTLWLFGDTFVGSAGQRDRVSSHFVHNSIGISECDADGTFRIRYHWGRGADGEPRAFLERDEGGWWWLQGGFVHDGRLFLALLGVEEATAHGPLTLPFRVTGTALAEIREPRGDPLGWKPRIRPLSHGAEVLPVAALVVQGAHLHLFAFLDRDDDRAPRILARLPLASLDAESVDLSAALETWSGDSWLPGLSPREARILMEDDATEMSVRFHPSLGQWLALYNYPRVAGSFPETRPSDAVYARTSPRLEGPWSEPRLVFRIPELAPGRSPPADPNLGCYAAKEQPQFSQTGNVTFTYVCNLFTGRGQDPFAVLRRLQLQMDVYRPVAASVTVPEPEPAAR